MSYIVIEVTIGGLIGGNRRTIVQLLPPSSKGQMHLRCLWCCGWVSMCVGNRSGDTSARLLPIP